MTILEKNTEIFLVKSKLERLVGKEMKVLILPKKQAYKELLKREPKIEDVVKTVCDYFHVEPEKVLTKSRKREFAQCRQISMYVLNTKTRMSLKNIGEYFGGRDHTTVIHSTQTVRDLMDVDEEYKKNVQTIMQKFL